jgi:ABC-type bacteriocin/lantibiotic exporter with double-glycine peptidase domain
VLSLKPYTAPAYYPGLPLADRTARVLCLRGFYQVRPYTCGFASALTVLRYYRRDVSERDLYERLGTGHDGTRQTAIVRELRRENLAVRVRYDLDFPAIARCIENNRLIIAYHHRIEHWVVVYGYALAPDRVFVADSYPGYRREHAWTDYGPKMRGFGIICSPRRRSGASLTRFAPLQRRA